MLIFVHLLNLLPAVLSAIIPLPSPPNPIPEPPTVGDFPSLTSEKQPPTALEITSVAHHLPRATDPSGDVEGKAESESKKPSRRRVRLHSHNSKVSRNREVEILHEKCNDEGLQEIMEDAITPSLSTSKMVISERATRDFGSPFDVICARGHFSYYVEASTYCEVTLNDVTCFAYRSSGEGSNQPDEFKDAITKKQTEKDD